MGGRKEKADKWVGDVSGRVIRVSKMHMMMSQYRSPGNGWEGGREGDARGKRCGNICICITDSLCYKAETNTPL